MKVGTLVRGVDFGDPDDVGIILEICVNMWGEEVEPSGVRIMWQDGDISVVYADEIVEI